MFFPAPPGAGATAAARHGAALSSPDCGPGPPGGGHRSLRPARYGTAAGPAWSAAQRLASRAGWEGHDGELPASRAPHPAAGRSPARGPQPATAVAVSHAPDLRRRGEPCLAGVPAPLRHREHVPAPQAGPRLDPAEAARPGRRRPVDLDHHRLHARRGWAAPSPPTCACPGSRPARPAATGRVRRGFRSSARGCPAWPARRNPANPDPAARQDQRTADRPPATCGQTSSERNPRRKPRRRVK